MKELERKELEELADEIREIVIVGPGDNRTVISEEGIRNSKVNHPSHYNKGKYECLDVVKDLIKDMSGVEGALFFNVFKYLWRYPHKNGIEDLKKCEFYLKDLIAFNENT